MGCRRRGRSCARHKTSTGLQESESEGMTRSECVKKEERKKQGRRQEWGSYIGRMLPRAQFIVSLEPEVLVAGSIATTKPVPDHPGCCVPIVLLGPVSKSTLTMPASTRNSWIRDLWIFCALFASLLVRAIRESRLIHFWTITGNCPMKRAHGVSLGHRPRRLGIGISTTFRCYAL